jgi:hypothetical protein
MDYRTYHAINQFVYHHPWLGRALSALETWAVPVIAIATSQVGLRRSASRKSTQTEARAITTTAARVH